MEQVHAVGWEKNPLHTRFLRSAEPLTLQQLIILPLGVIINTLCLNMVRFAEPDVGAIVEQLALALMRTTGAGDEAPDAGAIVEGLPDAFMSNAGAGMCSIAATCT